MWFWLLGVLCIDDDIVMFKLLGWLGLFLELIEVVVMWGMFGKMILFEVSSDLVEKFRLLVDLSWGMCWCCWRFEEVCESFMFLGNFVKEVILCDKWGIWIFWFIFKLEIWLVVLLILL